MSEHALWVIARDRLQPYGLLGRLENQVGEGWPDVVYCLKVPARPPVTGWLELKYLHAWPVRACTPVVIEHFTREQAMFIRDWTKAGGRADLLLQIGRWYLLLDAAVALALYRRELTQLDLKLQAQVCASGAFPARDLVAWLTREKK